MWRWDVSYCISLVASRVWVGADKSDVEMFDKKRKLE